ncbi:MAG: MarR family transcriptional regulator [Alphaproteobacteria bacterium]|nr:MarR family transcriptional regulator [Alphaproteobacteria bacterium]
MNALTDAGRPAEGAGDAEEPSDEFRLSQSPSHLLRRAQQFAAEIYLQAGLSDGVTLRQGVVLAAIAEGVVRSQSELVRATGVDRSTLADMVARMEKKGLIVRTTAADDGRAKSVSLTPAGRARLDEALPAMRQVDDALIGALPRNRRNAFRDTLGVLAGRADEMEVSEAEQARRLKKASKAARAAAKARAKDKKKRKKKKR